MISLVNCSKFSLAWTWVGEFTNFFKIFYVHFFDINYIFMMGYSYPFFFYLVKLSFILLTFLCCYAFSSFATLPVCSKSYIMVVKTKLQNGCLNRIIPEQKKNIFICCKLCKQAYMLHLSFVKMFTCLFQSLVPLAFPQKSLEFSKKSLDLKKSLD